MARHISCTFFLLALTWLVGCTYNPLSRHNDLTGSPMATGGGALVGGTTAAVLGASKPIIIASGLTGALAGYYASSLRFASGGIIHAGGQVFSQGQLVTIEVPTDNLFDTNSDEFLPGTEPVLYSILCVLQRYPQNNILISGNTSGFGTDRYQQRISEARARQVATYLWAHGVNTFQTGSITSRQLTYVGYGEYFPIANHLRAQSIRQNSRLQITAYPADMFLPTDKRFKSFNNIGSMGEFSLSKSPVDYNALFPGAILPENENPPRTDYKEGLENVNQILPGEVEVVSERRSFKGETQVDYKNVATVSQTNFGGNVVKHGGFKGENFKGEGG